jgi:orotidine-5'-phosphate decarboxylase
MFQKEINRFQKEIILFYVEEDNSRFPSSALCIGFDGIHGYQAAEIQLPLNFEDMVCFLKTNLLTMQESEHCMGFQDILLNATIQNNLRNRRSEIKTISDFKFADIITLGGNHIGHSLGQVNVNVKVWGYDDE